MRAFWLFSAARNSTWAWHTYLTWSLNLPCSSGVKAAPSSWLARNNSSKGSSQGKRDGDEERDDDTDREDGERERERERARA